MGKTFESLIDECVNTEEFDFEVAILRFTEEVCRLMEEQGVSKSELADRLGTSRSYVTSIMRGGNLSIRSIVRVARALDAEFRPALKGKSEVVQLYWRAPANQTKAVTKVKAPKEYTDASLAA